MASSAQLRRLQDIIEYNFTRIEYLEEALTAAGADEDNYDGNRKLSQLGELLIQCVLLFTAHTGGASRGGAHNAVQSVATKKHLEARAKHLGISDCIKCNPRQRGHPPSTTTLSRAVSAIVGASWYDSNQNFEISCKVVQRLVLSNDIQTSIAPQRTLLLEGSTEVDMDKWIEYSPPPLQESLHCATENVRQHSVHQVGSRQASFGAEPGQDAVLLQREHNRTIYEIQASDEERPEELQSEEISVHTLPHVAEAPDPHEGGSPASSEGHVHSGGDGCTGNIYHPQRAMVKKRGSTCRDPTTGSKRRLSADYARSYQTKAAVQLVEHVSLEKQRWQNLGLPCPEHFVNLKMNQIGGTPRNSELYIVELKILFFAIGSPGSLALLQSIIQAYRRSLPRNLAIAGCKLLKAERLKVIEELDENIAYFRFLKRCHIHQLFIDSRGSSRKTNDGFVNDTMQSLSIRKSPGNPAHIEDAQISKSILEEVYPRLQKDSPEYDKKYRHISDLRRLGQRLDALVDKFGYGIIGLLPVATDVSTPESILTISNKLILSLPDCVFKEFIVRLDQLQGKILRETSSAVCEIVEGIFQGTLDPSKSFRLEQLGQAQITEHPKGSPELLNLIS
ncbi:hypothetical protein B0J14DRAFT_185596 [Halenospora varia]|nr:hypothetical protein B0J14DRAFT_185596 [Halenospora varia]